MGHTNELSADNSSPLDSRQIEYMDWLVTPSHERVPKTQGEMAKRLGVDPTTLRRWEKRPMFKSEWDKRVSEIQGSPERTQKLLDALYTKALAGDNRAAQLYLQATNRLVTTPTVVQTVSAKELSDEELSRLLASMASDEQERRLRVV